MPRPLADDPKKSVTVTMPQSALSFWQEKADVNGETVARYLSRKLTEQAERKRAEEAGDKLAGEFAQAADSYFGQQAVAERQRTSTRQVETRFKERDKAKPKGDK